MSSPPPLPQALGPYELLGQLGTNGTLHTFAAKHRAQGHEVVITIVFADEVSGEAREQFVADAQKMIERHFEHVLAPAEWGLEGGWFWCASPRLDGDHTGQHMRTSGLPPAPLTFELARQVAVGLGELHALGISHGAVSPATVFVDTTARAVLIHSPWCGILQGLEGGYLHPSLMSVLPFTAPEVAANGKASPQGDAYSLGSVLYFLLLGRPTHWADDPESLLQSLKTDPVDFAPLREVIPPSGVELIEDLLEKAPEDRPINWLAMIERMGGIAEEMGAGAGAPPPVEAPSLDSAGMQLPTAAALQADIPTIRDADAGGEPEASTRPSGRPKRKRSKAQEEALAPSALPESGESAGAPPPPPSPAAPVFDAAARHKAAVAADQAPPSAAPELIGDEGRSKKVVLLIVLVGIVVLIGAVGGFFAFQFIGSKPAGKSGGQRTGNVRGSGPGAGAPKGDSQTPAEQPRDAYYTKTAEGLLAVGTRVQLFRNLKKRLPKNPADFGGTIPVDAWGTALDIREGFVVSAGKDKKWDTKDDIYYDPESQLIGGYLTGVDLPDEVLAK